jgi:hypothetical protein
MASGLCGVVVLVDEAAEDGGSADAVGGQVGDRRPGSVFGVGWVLVEGPVRPVAVVVGRVLLQHACQVLLVDDQGPVEELSSKCADEAFADRVRPGRLRRGLDDLDAAGIEHVKRVGSIFVGDFMLPVARPSGSTSPAFIREQASGMAVHRAAVGRPRHEGAGAPRQGAGLPCSAAIAGEPGEHRRGESGRSAGSVYCCSPNR